MRFGQRFLWILALALALRLVDIGAPVIGDYSWRQADTASIARNFAEDGFRFLYPQIDWRGDGPGYVESELPLYPFLVAVLYGIAGTHEIIARGVSVVFSIFTLIFLYWLVRETRDETTALWSCALLAVLPESVYVSRAIMPESLMLMASVAGILYFSRWSRSGAVAPLLVSALFISIACMVKLPALYLGLPLLYLASLRHGWKLLWAPSMWLFGLLVLLPVALWYWHAHQLLGETGLSFGIWAPGVDKWANWDLVLSAEYWQRVLVERIARRILTYASFAVFVIGLFATRVTRAERLFDYWLVGLGLTQELSPDFWHTSPISLHRSSVAV